jgi:hypothetical protein
MNCVLSNGIKEFQRHSNKTRLRRTFVAMVTHHFFDNIYSDDDCNNNAVVVWPCDVAHQTFSRMDAAFSTKGAASDHSDHNHFVQGVLNTHADMATISILILGHPAHLGGESKLYSTFSTFIFTQQASSSRLNYTRTTALHTQ